MTNNPNGFLADTDGSQSSMRLVMVLVVLIIMFGWLYTVIRTDSFVAFPSTTVWLLGLCFGGKVAQKFVELVNAKKDDNVPNS